LEQEKLNKRSLMYPHLALQINSRASSSQHLINFLKINQLGFMYSDGDVKKNFLINQFMDKILQLESFNVFKRHYLIFKPNDILKFTKEYSKKHKKSYRKKHLSKDIKKLKKNKFKKYFL
jgi:hypothetical protein